MDGKTYGLTVDRLFNSSSVQETHYQIHIPDEQETEAMTGVENFADAALDQEVPWIDNIEYENDNASVSMSPIESSASLEDYMGNSTTPTRAVGAPVWIGSGTRMGAKSEDNTRPYFDWALLSLVLDIKLTKVVLPVLSFLISWLPCLESMIPLLL